MIFRVFRTFSVCLWLVMISWLIRYEAFPERFTTSLDGYRSLIPKDVFFADSWMRITFKGTPIGLSHTTIDSDDASISCRYKMINRTDLKFRMMGRPQTLTVNSEVSLDSVFHLQKFSVAALFSGESMGVEGSRNRGSLFDLKIRSAGTTNTTTVEIPSDAVIYSPVSASALKHIEPGQEVKMSTFDPLAMRNTDTIVKAVRREFIRIEKKRQEAVVLETQYRNMKITTWVDDKGNVLRQELPFDLAMEKCTADDALAALRNAGGGEDLFSAISGRLFMWGGADD